ncbi:MAG TPA: hypothetical protein VFQ22_07680 [Longimicrobiales bacterium]|nr:hypothetical protein [Longimicrobiales bacterium]
MGGATIRATSARAVARAHRDGWNRAAAVYARLRAERPALPGWQLIDVDPDGLGAAWQHLRLGLRVIESVLPYGDEGQLWHHVSVSRASRLPSWNDLKQVRADFIGETRECYQVFPARERWVNDAPHVLHLWCSVDRPGGVLPDFRIAGTI